MNISHYKHSVKCVWSVVFKVVNEKGQIFSLCLECIGQSESEVHGEAINRLIEFNKTQVLQFLKLERIEFICTLDAKIKGVQNV